MAIATETRQDVLMREVTSISSRLVIGGSENCVSQETLSTASSMNKRLVDFYRCPPEFVDFELKGQVSEDAGFFTFGPRAICYGRCASGYRTKGADTTLYDASIGINPDAQTATIPFNPSDVIENLLFERYVRNQGVFDGWERSLKALYYFFRPLLHTEVRKHLQRAYLNGRGNPSFPHWPVDTTVENLCEELLLLSMRVRGVEKVPFIWFWPHGFESCVAMTHDVETTSGKDFCAELMDIDESFGIKASIQLVPEGRYRMSDSFLQSIRGRGFEVCVQDLNHDGNLFRDRAEFSQRAQQINKYGRAYGASGFRSAVLYRNLQWQGELEFSYDMSVPNVAHLDPQRGGCCTVLPYFFGETLEIPVTTTQDYMLFHLLGDYSPKLWQEQTKLILARNGLATFIVHPDYIVEKRAQGVYRSLLSFLCELKQQERIWFALPSDIDRWWRARNQMRLIAENGKWRIEGKGAEQAKLAFARITDGRLTYEVVGD